jgi:hypothetical protein
MSKYSDDLLTPMEEADVGSPSQEQRTRFVNDDAIRACGYEIESRPEKGEALWKKKGIVFKESEVIRREKL